MNRQEFNTKLCGALIISLLSSPIISGCSSEEIIDNQGDEGDDSKFDETGFYIENGVLYVSISNNNYISLNDIGSFINDQVNNKLILRKDEKSVLVFDNCCPHLGSRNRWSFVAGKFRCSNHGNSFGIGDSNYSLCSSGATKGNLKQFPATLVGKKIVIQI
ncbi:MAG: Rieske 2Fe-2S domain-containing protein [Flavobacteriaceae bacterium]